MNNMPAKIGLIIGAFIVICLYRTSMCMIVPGSEIAAYQAAISQMSDPLLIEKYQEEFKRLRKTFDSAAERTGLDTADINQLPIFRVAIFKAIINEIKKRQADNTHKKLLSNEQIKGADKLIQEKEAKFKKGGLIEKKL